jgi:Helix-turn-helix domain
MSRFLTKIINERPGENKKQQEPTDLGSPTTVSGPSNASAPLNVSGPSGEQAAGYPMDGPTGLSGPTVMSGPSTASTPKVDFIAALPEKGGRLELPHRYTDHACSQLTPDEQAVYLQLYRLSWGWAKDTCFISIPRLSERSNVPVSTLRRVIKKLTTKSLIEILDRKFGSNIEQGILFRVSRVAGPSTVSGPATMSGPLTVAPIKLKHTKKHTHKEGGDDEERASRGVSVVSKFSLEECRRYAEHLRSTGQGINNPGGYAITIHRTGEADELIERFLSPTPASAQADTSNCPDCQGTGFYYPKGKEQGVTKCPHSRIAD